MIVRHLVDRRPRGRAIAWSRKLTMDGALLAYHLFRRDMRGALHQKTLQYASQVATRELIAQLRQKLEAGAFPVPESGCWLWEHGVTRHGYGAVYSSNPREWHSAHRTAWLIFRGPIPGGMFVCHKCDTRRCINPDHLFLGTAQDNTDDMLEKGRQDFPAGQRHSHAKLTDADVLAMRASGLNSTDAGRAFGVTDSAAAQILNGKAWTHLPLATAPRPPQRIYRGELSPRAKLTAAEALSIYHSTGMARDVGDRYGVDESTVRAIRKGKIWRHLTGAKAA